MIDFMIYYLVINIFILGLIIGSFINCLLWRLHEEESILGRSYCPRCKKQIAWYDNIPVLSFLFLRGKCRKCKQKISFQYPLVELITGVLFSLVFYLNFQISNFEFIFNDSKFIIQLARDLFFVSVMIVVFIYDLKWYMILDKITLPSIIIIYFLNIYLGYDWKILLFSGLIGGGFFLIQFIISKGRWIGGGDIRLGFLMGVMFSWPLVLLAIFIGYLIGSFISIILVLISRKRWNSKVPLGIFLTASSFITLIWGKQILSWYLSILL